MNKRRNLTSTILPALLLLVLAGLLRFVIAEQLQILPADYSHTLDYTAESQLRESVNGQMSEAGVSVRQLTQTLIVTGPVAIIQNNLYWYAETGEVIFQSTGLYGVDRFTRMNLTGYGDTNRSGQFLFPPGITQQPFTFWDAMFIGLRQAEFEEIQVLAGMQLYKFHFSAEDMDETAGYSGLSEVPEQYSVHTDGEGTLWIEPLTGILVNYEESGVSHYVDPVSKKNVADLFIWSSTFSPETRASQAALAHSGRLRALALSVWLPGVLLAAALVWLLCGLFFGKRRTQR